MFFLSDHRHNCSGDDPVDLGPGHGPANMCSRGRNRAAASKDQIVVAPPNVIRIDNVAIGVIDFTEGAYGLCGQASNSVRRHSEGS